MNLPTVGKTSLLMNLQMLPCRTFRWNILMCQQSQAAGQSLFPSADLISWSVFFVLRPSRFLLSFPDSPLMSSPPFCKQTAPDICMFLQCPTARHPPFSAAPQLLIKIKPVTSQGAADTFRPIGVLATEAGTVRILSTSVTSPALTDPIDWNWFCSAHQSYENLIVIKTTFRMLSETKQLCNSAEDWSKRFVSKLWMFLF